MSRRGEFSHPPPPLGARFHFAAMDTRSSKVMVNFFAPVTPPPAFCHAVISKGAIASRCSDSSGGGGSLGCTPLGFGASWPARAAKLIAPPPPTAGAYDHDTAPILAAVDLRSDADRGNR